jgi:hypothetical protein
MSRAKFSGLLRGDQESCSRIRKTLWGLTEDAPDSNLARANDSRQALPTSPVTAFIQALTFKASGKIDLLNPAAF